MDNITLFFSWQSETGSKNELNRLISTAINNVCSSRICNEIIYTESTTNGCGSQNIVDIIIEGIKSCDIFLADISSVISLDGKGYSNPNVMYELGVASAILGWERIILLYNNDDVDFNSRPFDIHQNRTLILTREVDESIKADNLSKAIFKIIHDNPQRNIPKDYYFGRAKLIKHEHDARKIQEMFSLVFDLESWDNLFKGVGTSFCSHFLEYWEDFVAIYDRISWYIYDEKMRSLIDKFALDMNVFMNRLCEIYREISSGKFLIKENMDEDDHQLLVEKQKQINDVHLDFLEILTYIKEEYVEVDLDNCSKEARKNRIIRKEEILKRIGLS